jgi:putative protease
MKLLTTLYHLHHMKNLSTYVDGFLIGNEQFGTRLTSSFSIKEIKIAMNTAFGLNKDFYLVCNQIFNDDQLESFKSFISHFDFELITGFVVGDLGALRILSKMGFNNKVIYNPETLLTNSYDVNFLATENIKGVYLAKEITLDDIKCIALHKKLKLFMVGHGHLNMFYSKRQLIDNFVAYTDQENSYHAKQNLKIIEENRKDEAYPIMEDAAGTHVFRSNVFSSLNHLTELSTYIDYLVIDTLFKDDQYALHILPMYRHQEINVEIINQIKETYNETWDEGFLYTKTIYKNKG